MIASPDRETSSRENHSLSGNGRVRRMSLLASGFGVFAGMMFTLFTVTLVAGATAVPAESRVFMWVAVIAAITVALLLLTGAASMWARRPTGHLLIVASSLGIAYSVSFAVYNHFHGPAAYGAGNIGVVVGQVIFGAIPPIVALLCAYTAASLSSHGSTRRR